MFPGKLKPLLTSTENSSKGKNHKKKVKICIKGNKYSILFYYSIIIALQLLLHLMNSVTQVVIVTVVSLIIIFPIRLCLA